MKKINHIFLMMVFMGAVTMFLASPSSANSAEEVAVIVSIDNPISKLSLDEIKNFYDDNVLNWPNGEKIVAYDLPTRHDARKTFSNAVLGKDATDVAMEWANRKITNTAKNPPFTLKSEVLIQDKVGKNATAIGYIPKSKVTSSKVKVIAVIK